MWQDYKTISTAIFCINYLGHTEMIRDTSSRYAWPSCVNVFVVLISKQKWFLNHFCSLKLINEWAECFELKLQYCAYNSKSKTITSVFFFDFFKDSLDISWYLQAFLDNIIYFCCCSKYRQSKWRKHKEAFF